MAALGCLVSRKLTGGASSDVFCRLWEHYAAELETLNTVGLHLVVQEKCDSHNGFSTHV